MLLDLKIEKIRTLSKNDLYSFIFVYTDEDMDRTAVGSFIYAGSLKDALYIILDKFSLLIAFYGIKRDATNYSEVHEQLQELISIEEDNTREL